MRAGYDPYLLTVPVAQECGNYWLSFAGINEHLESVNSCLQLRKIKSGESVADLFRRISGVFIIFVDIFRLEDMETPFEELGSDAKIPHYIAYNAGTRLLQLYPTVSHTHFACGKPLAA